MCKFKDIKVGDNVLINDYIITGWHDKHYFFVNKLVEKTTPKQFVVDGNRYRKIDGKLIDKYSYEVYARIEGEFYNGKEIKNQQHEMDEFIKRVNIAKKINLLKKDIHISHESKNLEKILELIIECKKLQ